MKLLFDQYLSHHLVRLLEDLFPGAVHVRLLGLAEADDLTIWNFAIAHHCVIVTQDSDYSDWNKLRGAPPKSSGYVVATQRWISSIRNSELLPIRFSDWRQTRKSKW